MKEAVISHVEELSVAGNEQFIRRIVSQIGDRLTLSKVREYLCRRCFLLDRKADIVKCEGMFVYVVLIPC